jgi:CDP-diglyceride synthetase
MRKRILIGGTLTAAVVLLLFVDAKDRTGIFFASALALLTAAGVYEMLALTARLGARPAYATGTLAGFAFIALTWILYQRPTVDGPPSPPRTATPMAEPAPEDGPAPMVEPAPENGPAPMVEPAPDAGSGAEAGPVPEAKGLPWVLEFLQQQLGTGAPETHRMLLIELSLFLFLFATFIAYLCSGEPAQALPGLAATFFALFFVGFGMSFLLRLRLMDDHGYYRVWILLAVAKGGDVAAYFTGKKLGRRPLASRISPKKTLEGSAGGLAASALIGIGWAPIYPGVLLWHQGLLLGFILGIVSQASDLAESMVKRSAGVKDSSPLFGESGGILDQIDSMLLAAPLAFFFFALLPHGSSAAG